MPVSALNYHFKIKAYCLRFKNPLVFIAYFINKIQQKPKIILNTPIPVLYLFKNRKLYMIKNTLAVFASLYLNFALCGAETADYTKYRPLPLTELKTAHTIRVADLGAIPDDGKNDFEAVSKAFAAVQKSGGDVTLEFESGVYDFWHTKFDIKGGTYWQLKDLKNVRIAGKDTQFLVHDPVYGILSTSNCENFLIENFTIDYSKIPWAEGNISKVLDDENAIILKLRDSSPRLDDPMFCAKTWGAPLDPEVPGRYKLNHYNCWFFNPPKEWEKLDDAHYKIKIVGRKINSSPSGPRWEEGDRMFIMARNDVGVLFFSQNCRDITHRNITSYASPTAHYVGHFCERLNYIGCKALIKEGRWKSGNADFIHLQQNRVGPWIEGCEVQSVGDDSMVVYTRPFYIYDTDASFKNMVISRATYTEDGWRKHIPEKLREGDVRVGDTLMFTDSRSGEVLGRAKVAAFDRDTGKLEIDTPVKTELAESRGKPVVQVYNEAFSRGFVVKNNVFKNSRRYGLYWKASNGIIEGNYFEGQSNCAISLHNDVDAPNGPFCTDVLIINNTFRDNGLEGNYFTAPDSAVIAVKARALGHKISDSESCHKNIEIRDNNIINWSVNAILISNAENVKVIDNTIGAPMPNYLKHAPTPPPSNPVQVRCSKDVEVLN